MPLHASEIRELTHGDAHTLRHLGVPDAVRLNVNDSSYWYYDASSRTLHEWSCGCRCCMVTWRREDAPSKHCRFRRKYTVHDSWAQVAEDDLSTH